MFRCQVTYHLKEIYDFEMFNIHRETGLIRTTRVFDREKKSEYYIMVVAEDGAPSDRPHHRPPGTPNRGKADASCTKSSTSVSAIKRCFRFCEHNLWLGSFMHM